ncbi:MAG: ferritin-like domain-containing protein [Candidatus Dormibacteria bacterium]
MLNPNVTRRRFLGTTAIGAGGVISGATAIELLSTTRVWADAAGDLDILNFALTLEYLEADFYAKGVASVKFANAHDKAVFTLIASDEAAHVTALTDAISKAGGKPVAKPQVKYPAGTFESAAKFVTLAKTFEETGVSAYLGQAGAITNPDVLQAAASIFGIECRHAALVGRIAGLPPEGGIYMGATEKPKPKADVLAAVMPFLA